SDRAPDWNGTYQISNLRRLEAQEGNFVPVALVQTHADVFNNPAHAFVPVSAVQTPVALLDRNVSNFNLTFSLQQVGNTKRPALLATWDAVLDTRIKQVIVEYRRKAADGQPVFPSSNMPSDRPFDGQLLIGAADLLPGAEYEARPSIVADPPRPADDSHPWIAATVANNSFSFDDVLDDFADELANSTTAAGQAVQDNLEYAQLVDMNTDIEGVLQESRDRQEQSVQIGHASASIVRIDEVQVAQDEALALTRTELLASVAANDAKITQASQARADGDSALAQELQQLEARVDGTISAQITSLQQTTAAADSANATAITQLSAETDDRFASGSTSFRVEAGTGGALVRYSQLLKAGSTNTFLEAGTVYEIFETSPGVFESRMTGKFDKVLLGNTEVIALVNGTATLRAVNAETITGGLFQSPSNASRINMNDGSLLITQSLV
ncbi:MAG: hypothetical protein AAF737_04695, partial [Pseudomonadota bacterium]